MGSWDGTKTVEYHSVSYSLHTDGTIAGYHCHLDPVTRRLVTHLVGLWHQVDDAPAFPTELIELTFRHWLDQVRHSEYPRVELLKPDQPAPPDVREVAAQMDLLEYLDGINGSRSL